MEKSRDTSSQKTDRQRTDQSLIIERGKADDSFTESRKQTERQTDIFVEKQRNDADQKTSSSRIEADSNRDVKKQETLKNDVAGEGIAELKKDEARLDDERRKVDSVIKKERSQVDAAISKERDLTNASQSRFLETERGSTDQNLKVERDGTDSDTQQSSKHLAEEVADHSKTKISLTSREILLAVVSHDLRNPIGAISSSAEMLLDDPAYKNKDSENKQLIEIMKRSADTALRLISDILDMESIAEGKLQLKLEPQNIDKLIQESIDTFVYAASVKKVHLSALPSTGSGDVVCDHDRILQVLSNLISNALKFTPEGGSILLKAKQSATEMEVSVCDTGVGIPEGKQQIIFDRFSQVGSKDRKGLGLGLYISKTFIEAHHGQLWVESKVGEGATFYFAIPKTVANQ